MRCLILTCALAMLAPASCHGQALSLAAGGRAAAVIVVGASPTAAERTAADELTTYLGKVTGAAFSQVAEGDVPADTGAIFVGRTRFAARQGVDVRKLGPEEWVVRTVGHNLIITGGRPRGTIYAVYEFLERELGCHWLDERTEVVPSRPELALRRIGIRGQPAFCNRGVWDYVRGLMLSEPLFREEYWFQARNKANMADTYLGEEFGFNDSFGSPTGCHTFYLYIDPKEHFDKHPEWFSMNLNGERERDWGQLCLANPEVRTLVLERLREFIVQDRKAAARERRPDPTVYDISQNDFHHMCQCPQCRALAEREESDSGPLLDFINEIADGIKGDYPDVLVQTFAYTCTQKPPKTIRPRENVVIRLCDWGGELFRPLSDDHNREFRERLERWSELATHLSVWDYWIAYGDAFTTPYSNIRCLQPDLALFLSRGVERVFMQSEGAEDTSFFALKRWVGLKLMQEPRQSVEPLVETFMDGYYGPAGPKMTEYLHYLEDRIAADPDRLNDLSTYLRKYLDQAFFVKTEELLQQAEQACGDDAKLLLRVRRERVPVDGALLRLWSKLAAPGAIPFDREAVLARYEANRYAGLDLFRSPVTRPSGEADIAREMEKLRAGAVPLPEQFRDLPPGSVADFTWPDFAEAYFNAEPMALLRADPEAAGEKAIVYEGKGPDDHRSPPSFGVYDGARLVFGPSVELKPAEVPQDGAYHWYKIARFPVTNGVLVWAHRTWWISVRLDRAYDPAAPDPNWDIWVSLKVLGPEYVAGSTDKDGIWVDRIVLVRPEE